MSEMQATLWKSNPDFGPIVEPIDATLEVGAYEALWEDTAATFKSLSDRFASKPGTRPSSLVPEEQARALAARVIGKLRTRVADRFDVRVYGEVDYPARLRDAAHPVELLYFQGSWDLVSTRAVAVVGTRNPSPEGIRRTRQLVERLVEDSFTIVSGLAEGIDTVAHNTAIEAGGRTIAVLGTPLGQVYPKENIDLQARIAVDHLVISQVPVERFDAQDFRSNRFFFPERNKTMSALTEATIIIEAGETSGTLIQARAALHQKRLLFILNSCFERTDLKWPRTFLKRGAIRVHEYEDVRHKLVG